MSGLGALDELIDGGNDTMKIFTIIGGVNGTGKSSLTGVLRTEKKDLGMVVDVDRLIIKFNGNRLEGGKQAAKMIDNCLKHGLSFSQETTLSGRRTIKTANRARECGYFIRLYYVGLDSLEESLYRIQSRVKKGGHDIPEEDVLRRYHTRYKDIQQILPYCDEAVFYDNNNGFASVGEYLNGELIQKGKTIPKWFLELQQFLEK